MLFIFKKLSNLHKTTVLPEGICGTRQESPGKEQPVWMLRGRLCRVSTSSKAARMSEQSRPTGGGGGGLVLLIAPGSEAILETIWEQGKKLMEVLSINSGAAHLSRRVFEKGTL